MDGLDQLLGMAPIRITQLLHLVGQLGLGLVLGLGLGLGPCRP